MRPIDADAVIKEIWIIRGSLQMLDNTQGADLIMHGLWMVEEKINDAPTIDAVNVVRCKKCVKRMREDCPMCNGCKLDRVSTEDNDFCSYGEHKESK